MTSHVGFHWMVPGVSRCACSGDGTGPETLQIPPTLTAMQHIEEMIFIKNVFDPVFIEVTKSLYPRMFVR